MIVIILWFTSFSMIVSRSIHVAADGIISYFFSMSSAFSQRDYSYDFTSCFHSLKVSRSDRSEHSQVFTKHVHSPENVHDLLDFQEYVRAFQSSYFPKRFISQTFLPKF